MDVYKVPHTKWSTELQAILKGDALYAFLAVPPDDVGCYNTVKTALLVHAGVAPTDGLQRLLHFSPCSGATDAQFFATAKDKYITHYFSLSFMSRKTWK